MYQISRFYHKVHKRNVKQLWLWVRFPSPGLEVFFFLSFLHFSFLAFLTLTVLRVYSGECASVGRVLRVFIGQAFFP